jgi:hypothetical protein
MSRRETLGLGEQTGLSLPIRLLFPDPCLFGKPALEMSRGPAARFFTGENWRMAGGYCRTGAGALRARGLR